eukprot:CAMPEP_0184699450 /NCGR_PEP_ID=MMETSP0313-20130426/5721_1 /TAXON_ID=2792 /ORGANISM="Porphyridium aerugineum, Strain SAG 1380-2" /LENGTH=388 /DNA_ID=CAMNT_0027158545 /DNA_START=404 /DNA_END=1570 /DNA_ORIENTATION=+
MDPLAKQEALIKQSQGENYVGKRQAMVAARLQARGLKGRAYYDSADHSMQQQKKQQQQQQVQKEAHEGEAMDEAGDEGDEGDDAGEEQGHHHDDDKNSVNKFASESGSIGRKNTPPTHGTIGTRSTSKGAESGSLDEARSHLQSSGGNPVSVPGNEPVAPPVIKAATLPASVEKKIGAGGIGTTPLRAAVQPPAQQPLRAVSEPAKPVIKASGVAPSSSTSVAAPVAQAPSPAHAPADPSSTNISEHDASAGGGSSVATSSVKTASIRLKSGAAQVRQSAPSPAPQVKAGAAPGVVAPAAAVPAGGENIPAGPLPFVGRKLGTTSSAGIRSVNLAANIKPSGVVPTGGALPKAYDLNREQVIHKVPTGVSPLMKQVTTAKAVEDEDEE